jgi:hypothetical protein
MWIKSLRSLRRLTPRQLHDYYTREVRFFWTDRMTFSTGRKSCTPFERRHNTTTASQYWGWGRKEVRGHIAKLKAIRQMLRDGYKREQPRRTGVGACAVDREDEHGRQTPKHLRRDWLP